MQIYFLFLWSTICFPLSNLCSISFHLSPMGAFCLSHPDNPDNHPSNFRFTPFGTTGQLNVEFPLFPATHTDLHSNSEHFCPANFHLTLNCATLTVPGRTWRTFLTFRAVSAFRMCTVNTRVNRQTLGGLQKVTIKTPGSWAWLFSTKHFGCFKNWVKLHGMCLMG